MSLINFLKLSSMFCFFKEEKGQKVYASIVDSKNQVEGIAVTINNGVYTHVQKLGPKHNRKHFIRQGYTPITQEQFNRNCVKAYEYFDRVAGVSRPYA